MTVWLVVFLLANGEQAEVSPQWQTSKYECERARKSLEPDASARGWVARCIAWDIPADFSLARSADSGPGSAEAGPGGDAQLLRRLQELNTKADALDSSLEQVGSTAKNTEITVRDLERSLKRLEAVVETLRSRPCGR